MKKLHTTFLLFCLLCGAAWGQATSFTVNAIQIDGLQRISKSVVLNNLSVQKGQPFSMSSSSSIIQALYDTGYFNQVQLLRSGNTLIVKVHERPVIGAIKVTGHHSLPQDGLNSAMSSIGLVEGHVYRPMLLRQMEQELKSEEENRGFYNAKVTADVTPMSRNRVRVVIHLSEGLPAKVSQIYITGNHAFSVKKIRDQMSLTTPGFFTFITGNDEFSQDKFKEDLDAITHFYQNNGYLNFSIVSSNASLSENHKYVTLMINLHEGAQYTLSSYHFYGQTIVSDKVLNDAVAPYLKAGEIFSRKDSVKAIRAVKTVFGDLGYAFVNVVPVPQINEKSHKLSMGYLITPGRKVYVNQVTFTGNTMTSDHVLRRGMRVSEGGMLTTKNLKRSTQYLKNVGYLDHVKETTSKVPGTNDLANVDYNLKESERLNAVQFQVGYSQLYKVLFGIGYTTPNFLGTGNDLSSNIWWSGPYQSVDVVYTNPYFTESGVSQSIEVYASRIDTSEEDITDYVTNSFGGSVTYGFPVSEHTTVSIGGGANHTHLIPEDDNESITVGNFIDQYGDVYSDYRGIAGITYSNLDQWPYPTKGNVEKVKATVTGPGSDLTWYQVTASSHWYHPITQKLTFGVRGDVGYGEGYGSTDALPFFDNFGAGGWESSDTWGTMRGYETVGPYDTLCSTTYSNGVCSGTTSQGDSIGGNLMVLGGMSVYFPVPFLSDGQNMRLEAFTDVGNVYYNGSPIQYEDGNGDTQTADTGDRWPSFSNLGYSVGLAFEWYSPIGALNFSVAAPLNSAAGEGEVFQFSLGSSF